MHFETLSRSRCKKKNPCSELQWNEYMCQLIKFQYSTLCHLFILIRLNGSCFFSCSQIWFKRSGRKQVDICLSVAIMLQTDLASGRQRWIRRDHSIKTRWDKRCIPCGSQQHSLISWRVKAQALFPSAAPVLVLHQCSGKEWSLLFRTRCGQELKRNWIPKENLYQDRCRKCTSVEVSSTNSFHSKPFFFTFSQMQK